MLQVILWTITITSAAWGVLLCVVAIRNTAKQNELKRLVKHYKFNAEAMQQQFIQWRRQYEKMETGNTNDDFLGLRRQFKLHDKKLFLTRRNGLDPQPVQSDLPHSKRVVRFQT